MMGNDREENPDDNQPPTEQSVSAETDTQEEAVALADVLAVQEGDAIAVRAVQESIEGILVGQVTSFADGAETRKGVKQRLQEYTNTVVLSIDADTWWILSEGDTVDRSQELNDRPQMQEYLDLPPKDPPACSLSYWETGRIGVRIPMPVRNGSRVIYYSADDYGTVVALTHGAMIQPELLLPDTYTPPVVWGACYPTQAENHAHGHRSTRVSSHEQPQRTSDLISTGG
jgi:hypothetical protein